MIFFVLINGLIYIFIFCNHLTTFNTDNISRINIDTNDSKNNNILSDKTVTWIEKFVFNKFSQLGYDILNEQKNRFINYAICLILKDLFTNDINKSTIIKELVENKDYDLLNIFSSILLNSKDCFKINIRDALKHLIICNATNNDISQMKSNLIHLYQKIPEYDNEEFENFDFNYINSFN